MPQRLPQSLLNELESDKQGLGELLRHSGLETRRELLWCGIETLSDLPPAVEHIEGETVYQSRLPNVSEITKPLMMINEKFPF